MAKRKPRAKRVKPIVREIEDAIWNEVNHAEAALMEFERAAADLKELIYLASLLKKEGKLTAGQLATIKWLARDQFPRFRRGSFKPRGKVPKGLTKYLD